ncbi:MAG: hypothetical protein ABIF71_01120 [Planctomycetota bacterium]
MTILRPILAIGIMLAATYIMIMNWGCVIVSERNKRKGIDKYHSTVPLVTLILACLAYQAYPYKPALWIGIIPAFDIGNWYLLWMPVVLWKEFRKNEHKGL